MHFNLRFYLKEQSIYTMSRPTAFLSTASIFAATGTLDDRDQQNNLTTQVIASANTDDKTEVFDDI